MPRFIRANNKSGGNFIKLKGKPAQLGQNQKFELLRQGSNQNLDKKRQLI